MSRKKRKKAQRDRDAKRKRRRQGNVNGRKDLLAEMMAGGASVPPEGGGGTGGESRPPCSITGGLFPKSDACMPYVRSREGSEEGRKTENRARKKQAEKEDSEYIAPRELVERWRCARSSVDRIARRAGMTRVCLGEGRNGLVRYIREEVLAYEKSKQVRM